MYKMRQQDEKERRQRGEGREEEEEEEEESEAGHFTSTLIKPTAEKRSRKKPD